MNSKLVEKLKFKMEPVAVFFTDEKPEGATQAKEGSRVCVASMLVAASKGKVVVFDEKTYGCAGGGVGLCFGDTYAKMNQPIECLLSTGDEALRETGKTSPRSYGKGERFFETPELADKWRRSLPFTETPEKYVVFKPLGKAGEEKPDLICIFANPDQLSALVTMSGFYRGDIVNALAPFGAACHSILYAYQEIKKEKPKGVLGFFDISQRKSISKELLSYTVPYGLYMELERQIDESCLGTEVWEEIESRFD